jgi:ComF family protein
MVYGWLSRSFVESCPACAGASARGFCDVCAAEFARVQRPCGRCGLALPAARCPREQAVWHVDAVVAPLRYGPPLDHYLHALKYRGARLIGRALALLLAAGLHERRDQIDALVPVPLHRTRLCTRGYNQARELARTLGHALRLPVLERGIRRVVATPPQTGQSAVERRADIARAFHVERRLVGLRVAIVDDVVTTGATINALAGALKAAGAARCIAVAVARTPEPNQKRNV